MSKSFCSLGLMSGTSMDGVDASIIQSDGETEYRDILDKYFEYPKNIYNNLTKIRDKIKNQEDLKEFSKEITILEKDITLFHAEIVNKLARKTKENIDLVGFHGQTIFHNANEKISKQLGDGKLLSKLTKKTVIYDFRQNDLKNGGQGAPLTPIFHNIVANKINESYKIGFPISILNIGGISNITTTMDKKNPMDFLLPNQISAYDIGPGNCLIDEWVRKKTKKKYDEDGLIAKSGNTDKLILNKALKNLNKVSYDRSLDTKDFDLSFAKELSLKDGASTLTDFTATLIAKGIRYSNSIGHPRLTKWLVCGGGRKNKYLMDAIINKGFNYLKASEHVNKKIEVEKNYDEWLDSAIITSNEHVANQQLDDFKTISFESIDKYGIDGDFVESQAFAYLAVRSYLKLPISYPSTTGVKKPCSGGRIFKY